LTVPWSDQYLSKNLSGEAFFDTNEMKWNAVPFSFASFLSRLQRKEVAVFLDCKRNQERILE
jgi:hypothetical protein